MEEIAKILLGAVVGYFFGIANYNYKFKKELEIERKKEKLTKLLLPLYTNLKQLEGTLQACIESDNYGPEEFFDDLPNVLTPLITTVNKHLYLADAEFVAAALGFVKWYETASSDKQRFTNIMQNKLNEIDKPFIKFKKIVYETYEKEQKEYLRT